MGEREVGRVLNVITFLKLGILYVQLYIKLLYIHSYKTHKWLLPNRDNVSAKLNPSYCTVAAFKLREVRADESDQLWYKE